MNSRRPRTLTRDFGIVAIIGVVVALLLGLNDFYDRSSDNLYSRKRDCLTSLMNTYDVLIRRSSLANQLAINNDASMQEKAVDSDIEMNGKWAGVEAGCVMPGLLPHDKQVGGALATAKEKSQVPPTQASADPNGITGSANWVRFAIAEIYGVKITQGWIITCNPIKCFHSYPDQRYTFGDQYGAQE